jgi:mannitol/fructose-specific phosphotransferase system IIA component (Ntr-type)
VGDLLTAARVRIPLFSTDKQGAVAELVDMVAAAEGLATEREALYRAVWQREEVLSTGIGEGVALPHAVHASVPSPLMAAGVSKVPLEFGSLDGKPVRIIFLILGPQGAAELQVRLLSRIVRLVRDEALRARLIQAPDAMSFLDIVQEAERGL